MKPGPQWFQIKNVSAGNNQHIENAGQSTRANRPLKMSFSILRDQFSSLPIEERLQFLSWFFEGALSQCLHIPTRSNDVLNSNDISKDEEGITTSSAEQSSGEARVAHGQHICSLRKGLPWLPEESRLLVQLRRKNLLPGRKCLSHLIRDSRGGVKVLYKYTGSRHPRSSCYLSGGYGQCYLYQTMPSPVPISLQFAVNIECCG